MSSASYAGNPTKRRRRPCSRFDANVFQTSPKHLKTSIQASAINDKRRKSSPSEHSDGTVDSQICLPFPATTWRDVRQKLESIGWIQCDNLDCRKWRKCPRKELVNISDKDKWYCRQNSDPQFSSCQAPEEDTEFYDRLAERSGLTYLKSELKPGDLVWARMSGYCRWPALVSKDPATGSVTWSQEVVGGEEKISHYHVEFLGQPHSHSWVCARHVTAFTVQSSAGECVPPAVQQNMEDTKENTPPGAVGRKLGHPPLRAASKQPKMKTTYKNGKIKTTYKNGVSVADGVEEAMKLLPLSPSQRLQHCTYLCQESHLENAPPDNIERQPTKSIQCSPRCKDKMKSQSAEKTRSIGCGTTQIRGSQTRTKQSVKRATSAAASASSATTLGGLEYATFCTSLNTKTKEERLLLDIEMYKRNEQAFDHDVTRFMLRNGLKMAKGPFWQNQRISLFQLFLAVHERGGYQEVTSCRGWAAVYREVTDLSCSGDFNYSSAARNFYSRYLYPFELYIRGKDFKDHIDIKTKRGKREGVKDKIGSQIHQPMKTKSRAVSWTMDTCAATTGVEKTEVKTEEEDVASESLLEMLQAIEEHSKLDFEESVKIIFHDDSTPSTKDLLPSIHREANYPHADSVHAVPSVDCQKEKSDSTELVSIADSFHAVPSVDCQKEKSDSTELVSMADSFHAVPSVDCQEEKSDSFYAVPSINCQRETSDSAKLNAENVLSRSPCKLNNDSDSEDSLLDLGHATEKVVTPQTGDQEIDGNESDQDSSACSGVLLHQLQVLQDGIKFIEDQLISDD